MYKIKFYKFVKQFLEVRKHFYQLHFWFPETNCSGFSEQFVFFLRVHRRRKYVFIIREQLRKQNKQTRERDDK